MTNSSSERASLARIPCRGQAESKSFYSEKEIELGDELRQQRESCRMWARAMDVVSAGACEPCVSYGLCHSDGRWPGSFLSCEVGVLLPSFLTGLWRESELLKNVIRNFDSSQGFLLLLLCVPERGGGEEEREKQREGGREKEGQRERKRQRKRKRERGRGKGEREEVGGEGGERRRRERERVSHGFCNKFHKLSGLIQHTFILPQLQPEVWNQFHDQHGSVSRALCSGGRERSHSPLLTASRAAFLESLGLWQFSFYSSNLSRLKSLLHRIYKVSFTNKRTFTGARDQDTDTFGDHYSWTTCVYVCVCV